jgi:hypothetical protein
LNKDRKSSLFFLFFAGVMLVSSVQASLGTFSNPGSGLVSFLAALLLAFFSLVNLILPSLRKGEKRERSAFSTSEVNHKNLFVTLISVAAFPVVLKPLGLGVTMFGFMLLMSKVVGARRWAGAILFSLVTTFVGYLFFVYWLKLFGDKGILGIY